MEHEKQSPRASTSCPGPEAGDIGLGMQKERSLSSRSVSLTGFAGITPDERRSVSDEGNLGYYGQYSALLVGAVVRASSDESSDSGS